VAKEIAGVNIKKCAYSEHPRFSDLPSPAMPDPSSCGKRVIRKKEIGWEWLGELPEPIEIEAESFEMLGSWWVDTKKPARGGLRPGIIIKVWLRDRI
jgi:hypothetical protein